MRARWWRRASPPRRSRSREPTPRCGSVLPAPALLSAVGYLGAGIVLLGVGTGMYLSAALGSGPRDSLMIALARRPGFDLARAAAELSALAAGLLLGGRAGAGTLIYAVTIGPVAQWGIALFREERTCR
jgi:uncharacterized membrane protein YczE